MGPEFFLTLEEMQGRINFQVLEDIKMYSAMNDMLESEMEKAVTSWLEEQASLDELGHRVNVVIGDGHYHFPRRV